MWLNSELWLKKSMLLGFFVSLFFFPMLLGFRV